MKFLVTGGAGFIGSALVRHLIGINQQVLNIDKLTYSADLFNVSSVANHPSYSPLKADICDKNTIQKSFEEFQPDVVIHLAAESHVDRSIEGPQVFVETNVVGTSVMLDAAFNYWKDLTSAGRESFRFLHVSTDEVYGELGAIGLFTESTPYQPSSPYSASKAASDHFARAWQRTYGLPVLITNCSNNYGPFQHPEKLIPTVIKTAIAGDPIPVYGKGDNIRDWLYVDDHVQAILKVVETGRIGETYNVGGNSEKKNIDIVTDICKLLNHSHPHVNGHCYTDQITYVSDRPGHDFRYAIDNSKIKNELGWQPLENFQSGLSKTVNWYLDNKDWWQKNKKDSGRLGLNADLNKED